jgi:3-hydroxybutyryl-CoA dehydrogenase
MSIQQVTVIGAGTMGNGIAHVFAQSGFQVILADIDQSALDQALKTIESNLDRMVRKEKITGDKKVSTLKHISTQTILADAVKNAELVVEAVSEDPALKQKIFSELDRVCHPDTILATNTSSISITEIASATTRPGQVIGMHFMNPVPIMRLVEIIRGYETTDAVTHVIMEITQKLGKVPLVANDFPGFVANRILMPMINEAIITFHEGVAGIHEIDHIMKLGMAHPMGPLELADFIGLDVCLAILKVLHEGLGNPKYAPCPLLINMVNAGKLGRKSGAGFYDYSGETSTPLKVK